MGKQEEQHYDLSLVTTYLPCVVLCMRGFLLVTGLYFARVYVEPQTCVILVCGLVYLDAWQFKRNAFDRTCGHLCLCAMATLAQSHHCVENTYISQYNSLLLWLCDLVWGVLSAFDVVGAILGMRSPVMPSAKICLLTALATTHTHFQCQGTHLPDMLLRTLLYYLLCAMLIFCGPMIPNFDRNAHNSNVLHVCCHLLFVHAYIMLGSVFIISGVHGHLIYMRLRSKQPKSDYIPDFEAAEEPRRRDLRDVRDVRKQEKETPRDHELILKLQQAKLASGVA